MVMQAIPDPLAELPLESVPAGVLRVVYALWLAKRPPDGYPGRRDFAPSEMVRQLPYINLLDVEGRPPRFHNRLVGTAIVEASGIDMTGRYFDEFAETGDSQARCRHDPRRADLPESRLRGFRYLTGLAGARRFPGRAAGAHPVRRAFRNGMMTSRRMRSSGQSAERPRWPPAGLIQACFGNPLRSSR